MVCLETDIPDKFNIALEKTSKYKVGNLGLFMYNAGGIELLIFRKNRQIERRNQIDVFNFNIS